MLSLFFINVIKKCYNILSGDTMIKQKLSLVPNQPGCYLMKNSDGIVIYVGKAKDLKKRLQSYFRGTHTGKTGKMISEITDFDYIVVGSETEALIQELNLIKEFDPKYNILLRDDKSYPYIELTNDEYPKLEVVRRLNKKKRNSGYIFGPYPNVTAAKSTVLLLNRMYPLRKCNNKKDPCFYYHLGQCLACGYEDVDPKIIEQMKEDVIKFLKGDHSLITEKIKDEMYLESSKMNYEKAAELKELLDYIMITLEKQKVEINDDVSRDVFGYFVDKGYLSIQVFFIRGGKIVENHNKIVPMIDEASSELTTYIAKFYEKYFILPKEILVPGIVNAETLEDYLETKVLIPQRGTKRKILEMANMNAKIKLEEKIELIKRDESRTTEANEKLKKLLNLKILDRIEVFDNSHLFGTFYVAGMVVFVDGKPDKKEYRKFKITLTKNDDYEAMREVIYRRYFRVLRDNLLRPSLIIVDGGVGQVNAARDVLDSLELNIPVIGLKKDERHDTSTVLAFDPIKEITINKHSDLFHYLERISDEVHQYTINYHRQIRSKGSLSSILDSVPGIGPKRKKELLKKYRSITKLKELSAEELNTVLPLEVAKNLKKILKNY